MISRHLRPRGLDDPDVLRAVAEVDRALFVPENHRDEAYADRPLPIGRGQTISQPYIVAYMARALKLGPGDKVLEVGAGCGYNAAVLSRIAEHIYSIEIIPWLADLAQENLDKGGFDRVTIRKGDGYAGWPEKSPFDAIVLTAAPPAIPEPLKQQLKVGGRLLAPVGRGTQNLMLLEKKAQRKFREHPLIPVRFVPMTGQAESPPS